MSSGHNLGMGGDPSQRMFAAAKELLWRQRVIHKFPCDRDEVLISLLPPEAQDLVLGKEIADIQWKNLTQCVSFSSTVLIELDGKTGKAFWFTFNRLRPTPIGSDAFVMLPENRHYDEVYRWWASAYETHKKLMRYEQALYDFFSKATHPVLVEKYWPELHKFVGFQPLPNQVDPNLTKRRVVVLPSDGERTSIIETLAGSTLLEKFECNTWVDYETEG